MDEASKQKKAIVAAVVVALLAIATTGVVAFGGRDNDSRVAADTTSETTAQPSTSPSKTTKTSGFKDGTYTAKGSYRTPGGQESMEVTLKLTGDTVTDVSVKQEAISNEAHEYQDAFVSGYKSQVVGKKIGDISLSRVSGSSLTPNGFNSALDTIKSQAS